MVHPGLSSPENTEMFKYYDFCLNFAPPPHFRTSGTWVTVHLFHLMCMYFFIPWQRIRGFVRRKSIYRCFRSPQFFHPVRSLAGIVRIEFVEPGFHAELEVSQKVVCVPQGRIRVFVIASVQMVRSILVLWRDLQGGFLHLISIQQSRTGSC